MSFIRRYGFYPSTEQITQIEGVIIIDLPPPSSIAGVGTGTTAVVGEFADVTFATKVDSSGTVTTDLRPVEVFSAQDLLNKVGGWDETLGDFGGTNGNGYAAITGKQFSRLIIVPINNASSKGVRLFRDLPTNKPGTVIPIVPLTAGIVQAGREFASGVNKVRLAKRVVFTDDQPRTTGITGDVTAVGGATTAPKTFTDAGANFITAGVKVGDALVLGALGGAGANLSNADTWRITAITDGQNLLVEKQDRSAFDWTTGNNLVYRIHPGSTADTGGEFDGSSDGGYVIPARPTVATIAQNTNCTPTIVPTASSATAWDSLSGLTMRTTPNVAGLVFTATIQTPNQATNATLTTEYGKALDALLSNSVPASDVNIVFSARQALAGTAGIANLLKNHVIQASASGLGRMAVIAPPLGTSADTIDEVVADTWPGVGSERNERVVYSWPPCQVSISEAVGFSVETSLGTLVQDGILDMPMDSFVASVLSVLPPERNPAQAAPPATTALARILGFARSIAPLGMNEYTTMRARGICGLRIDRNVGPLLQSGITTSTATAEKNIARRRMADFIEDSLAGALVRFSKLPLTDQLKDGILTQVDQFLSALLSQDNPAAQRINGYLIDSESGNTPALEAQGIYCVIVKVRTLASADFIVIQAEIGEGVNVSAQ